MPMSALTVLIIRHAEKPESGSPEPGLGLDGSPDPRSLNLRGWQRAGAWAALFGTGRGGPDYPGPAVIYACDPGDDATDAQPSRRPWQTIVPLAERLGLLPQIQWARDEEPQLAADVASLSGTVLICWEHRRIAEALLPALLGNQRVEGAPSAWDKHRFDVVLRLDRPAPEAAWSFRQLFPLLLAGDQNLPL
jgi:broad specificity phosphatase PhoE